MLCNPGHHSVCHTYVLTHTCTHMHTHTSHIHAHTYMYTHAHTSHIHAHTHHTYMRTHITHTSHTHAHTYMHTHITSHICIAILSVMLFGLYLLILYALSKPYIPRSLIVFLPVSTNGRLCLLTCLSPPG